MRKLVSLPGKGIFSLQGKSLSGHRVVAVPSSPHGKARHSTGLPPHFWEKKRAQKTCEPWARAAWGLLDILAGRRARSFCDWLQACSCPFAELLKSLNQI